MSGLSKGMSILSAARKKLLASKNVGVPAGRSRFPISMSSSSHRPKTGVAKPSENAPRRADRNFQASINAARADE